MTDWPPGGRYWAMLAQNDDHALIGNDRGEVKAIPQRLAVQMFDLQMLSTCSTLRWDKDTVRFTLDGTAAGLTPEYHLREIIDPATGLSVTAVFMPPEHTGSPSGVWIIRRPQLKPA